MTTKTFYAIYDVPSKKFKGRGNVRGVRWTDEPTQTYDTISRAKSALKAHLKVWNRYPWLSSVQQRDKYLIVIPVTVSWEDHQEVLEGMFE